MHNRIASSLFASLLYSLTYAHFELKSPPARGFDEDALEEYPCGGQNSQSGDRAAFPLGGGPIELDMGHDHALVQVNLALGNMATDGNVFSIRLQPLVQQEGLGAFCLPDVVIPSALNVKDGDNGTIQVVTNGDPTGGLYNCADVTFSSAAKQGECTNGTNVKAMTYSGSMENANGTQTSTETSQSSSAAPSASATGSATTPGLALGLLELCVGAAVLSSFV